FTKPEQVKFKYKLEGHDADWIDAGTKRTAYYSYLPPGNYTFRVKAANSDGVWNEEGATLNIELKPFFYQTGWFYLVCIATLALTLLIVWKTSVYQLELREKRLARLVDEKTEELRKANEELQLLANSDGLTQIGNRRLFEEFLQSEWHRAIRFKTEISLILLDIDHFKLFNDTYGHQNGDDCLKNVSQALRDTIHRPTDLLARFGGEEFAIILGGTDMQGALTIAEQAMENVRNLQIIHESSETGEHLTISIGVATTFVSLGMSEADLIKAADEALYKAKAEGRNRIVSNNLTLNFEGLSELEKESLGLI
nr:diguanylate cyclase [Pyrinomonadaceae bacterium]